MTRNIVKQCMAATIVTALAATPALAQTPESVVTGGQSTFSVTPYAGYMFFGNLADLGPNSTLTNDDSWIAGAQAKIRMTSRWAVVGNAAYSKTNFESEPKSGTTIADRVSGDIGYWLADVGLQYQLPFNWSEGKVSPFLQAGVGAVRYSAEADDLNSDNTTNVQFNGGVGLDIDRGPVGFQVMLKDYVTSFDWDKVRGIEVDEIVTGDADRSRIAHNLALTAGLRINF